MKAFFIIASLGTALAGCSVYPPVAVERVYTTPATVAVSPTYVAPPGAVVMGAPPASLIDSDGDGYSNAIDRFPYDASRY